MAIDTIEIELAELTVVEAPAQAKKQPKHAPLPPELPRTLIHHEPEIPSATAVASLSVLAKTPVKSWITCRASSP